MNLRIGPGEEEAGGGGLVAGKGKGAATHVACSRTSWSALGLWRRRDKLCSRKML